MSKQNVVVSIVLIVVATLGALFIARSDDKIVSPGSPAPSIVSTNDTEPPNQFRASGGGGAVPDLTFIDFAGNDVVLRDLVGTPMVINAWATWCPFCRHELPDFAAVQEELGDEVIFVAVDRRESLSKAKGYTDSLQLTDKMLFVLDEDDTFYHSIGGISMPETIFVNADGIIVDHKRGVMNLEETRARTQRLLQQ